MWSSDDGARAKRGAAEPPDGAGARMINSLFYHAIAVPPERVGPGAEAVGGDRLAHPGGQPEVVMEVVYGVEPGTEDLVHPLQMVQVRAGEVQAGMAAALLVDRAGVRAMSRYGS